MGSLKPKIESMHEQGKMLRDLPWCGEFRQTGMIAAVELVRNRETLEPFPVEQRVGHQIFLEGLKREVYSASPGERGLFYSAAGDRTRPN